MSVTAETINIINDSLNEYPKSEIVAGLAVLAGIGLAEYTIDLPSPIVYPVIVYGGTAIIDGFRRLRNSR